jgi:hypothetical protein
MALITGPVDVRVHRTLQYIDAGRTEQSADGVRTVMPCCGVEVPFEAVRFGHSGFAVFELVVSNPDADYPLGSEVVGQLEAVLGCPLRQVWARY